MYSRVNYTVVGLFVLLFGIGMVAFSFWLAKYGLQQKYELYKVYMTESVSGLSKDSVVKLRGVDVGRVKSVRIAPDNVEQVEIILEIKEGTPIKEDMRAHTTMLGVTGLLAIEIDGGSNDAGTLQPKEGHIPVIASSPSWFYNTRKDIGKLAQKLSAAVSRAEMLLSEENVERFSRILKNTETLTAKGSSVLDEANRTVAVYREAAVNFNRHMESMKHSFVALSRQTMPTVKKLMETSRNFNRLTLKVERSLDRGDYNLRKILEPVLVDVEILAEQMDTVVKKVGDHPGDLFFKSRTVKYGPGEKQ